MKRLTDMFIFKFVREFKAQIAACYAERGIVDAVRHMRVMFNEEGEKAVPGWVNQFTGQVAFPPLDEERVPNVGLGVAKMLVEWAVLADENRKLREEIKDINADVANGGVRIGELNAELVKLRVSIARIAQATGQEYTVQNDEKADFVIAPCMQYDALRALAEEYPRGWNYLAGCVHEVVGAKRHV